MADTKTFTIEYDGLKLVVTATDNGDGTTSISINCVEGYADINAFFWHDGVDDGSSFALAGKKDSSLNMNGTGEDWDDGLKLSSSGLGSDGTAKSTYLTEGETLPSFNINISFADLDTIGIRATSTSNPEGSIKGVAEEDDPPPPQDDFPLWEQNISHIVLYFDQSDGDVKPAGGDGYYLVKIDDVPGTAADDLDDWIDDALAWLIANDPNIDASSDLLGAVVKGGTQTTQYFSYGVHNTNGTAADTIPADAPQIETPPPQGDINGPEIDASYDYSVLGIV